MSGFPASTGPLVKARPLLRWSTDCNRKVAYRYVYVYPITSQGRYLFDIFASPLNPAIREEEHLAPDEMSHLGGK